MRKTNNVLTVNLSFISLIKVKIKCYDIKIYRNKQMSYLTFKFFIIWEVYWTSATSTLKKVEKPSFFSSTIDDEKVKLIFSLMCSGVTIYFSQMKMSSCKILSNCPVPALVTIDTRIYNIFNHRPLIVDKWHKFVDYWPNRKMVWFLLILHSVPIRNDPDPINVYNNFQ